MNPINGVSKTILFKPTFRLHWPYVRVVGSHDSHDIGQTEPPKKPYLTICHVFLTTIDHDAATYIYIFFTISFNEINL